MTHREKLRHLPAAIRGLRRRAGFTSVSAAAQGIREKTGEAFSRPTLSKWENGRLTPSLDVLATFLEGLGLDWKDFQDELDRVAGGETVPRPSVAAKPARAPRSRPRRESSGWMAWED